MHLLLLIVYYPKIVLEYAAILLQLKVRASIRKQTVSKRINSRRASYDDQV